MLMANWKSNLQKRRNASCGSNNERILMSSWVVVFSPWGSEGDSWGRGGGGEHPASRTLYSRGQIHEAVPS